jgi:hypothetical protein
MKRNISIDDMKRKSKKSKYSSLTIDDSLGSISEPAISTSTTDPSVSTSAAAASAQVTQVAGVTVSIQLHPLHP